jgi:hypothetical protein
MSITASRALRVASITSLLVAIGHTLGGRKYWSPMGPNVVLEAMQSVPFKVFGVTRTYLDFYRGFGFCLGVFMLLQAVLLWQIAGTIEANRASARAMIAAFLVASIAVGILTAVFILPLPAALMAVVALSLLVAYLKTR